jgi:GNAT superfamily N-acetyltransferase
MNLVFDQLKRPAGERLWFPFEFDEAAEGFTPEWWHHGPVYPESDSTFFRVLNDSKEVARVELDDEVGIEHYAGVPALGPIALEIQFIEVHIEHRGRGIGRAVVDQLADLHPGRRLVAFSEDADDFWSSLGWRRYLHADPRQAPHYRPLFIQPAT